MCRRSALLTALLMAAGTLAALMLASCGGDDERYPPFEMTYTVTQGQGGGQQTWELDYRGADDWTELVTFDRETGIPLRYEMSEPDVVDGTLEVVELDIRQ